MSRALAIVFSVVVLAIIVTTIVPILLVGPFLSQTPTDLSLSRTLGQWSPSATILLLIAGSVLAVLILRRGAGRLGKTGVILGCTVMLAFAFAAQLRPAEIVFARLPEVVRIPVDRAEHVVREDLVLGVTTRAESAAYPVLIVAFHHIVNDQLAGEPFVVTY